MDERQMELLRETRLRHRGAAIIDGAPDSFRFDGYTNLLNRYGTSQDNSTAYTYEGEPVADDLELIRLYEGNGLFAKIIDRPSEEAVKHGLDIDFGDAETAKYVENCLDGLDFEDRFATAEKWARLYGGSIIVMLADDGRGLEEPLNLKDVRSIQELRVFERAIVQPDYTSLYNFHFMDSMKADRPFGEPERYAVFSVYGYFMVHRSRCLVFRNGRLPEQTTDANYRYWGIPEYVKIKRALRECVTAHEDGVKLMERSVQAVYKMKNLANLLATDDGEGKVLQRLQVIDMARGILNSIAIDNEGEDYDYKNSPTSGVKEIIDSTCNMLSAVTSIPQTVLFGRSPAGENSTGRSDLENYYNMVENIQKQNMKANTRTVIDLILRQGLYDGKISGIPEYKVKFAPLWSMSGTEQADVAQKRAQTDQVKAQTVSAYIDAGVIDPSEVRRSLAKDGVMEIGEIISEADLEEMPELTVPGESGEGTEETGKDNSGREHSDAGNAYQAAAVLIFKNGRILCADRTDGQGICGAGGHCKPGETPEETALREAQEEFNVVPLSLYPVGELKSSTGLYLTTMLYFSDRFTGTPEADGMEMTNERWMTLDELRNADLFPAFEKSLDIFIDALRPFARTGSANVKGVEIANHLLDKSSHSGIIKEKNLRTDGKGKDKDSGKSKGKWVTINGTHVQIGEGGEIAKGPANLKGETPQKTGESKSVSSSALSSSSPEGVKKPKVKPTHFKREGNTVEITAETKIKVNEHKRSVMLPGTITDVYDFAGGSAKKPVEKESFLIEQYGGKPGSWRHTAGNGMVKSAKGKAKKVEIHWFESDEVGQVGWKVKAWKPHKRGGTK